MKTTRLSSLFFIVFLALGVSCGNRDQNRTFGGSPFVNPAFPGLQDGIPFAQKFQSLITHPNMICVGNAPRVTIGFQFQSTGFGQPQVVGVNNVNLDLNNLSGVKTLYVGSTPERDVVVVKDYGVTKDVIISLCDLDLWGPAITNVQIYGEFFGSPATSCTVNQISEFNFGVIYPQSSQPIILQVAPINGSSPIEGICPFDFYSEQML